MLSLCHLVFSVEGDQRICTTISSESIALSVPTPTRGMGFEAVYSWIASFGARKAGAFSDLCTKSLITLLRDAQLRQPLVKILFQSV